MIAIARQCSLRRLEVELNGERKIALKVLHQLGFSTLMHLEKYVLDMHAVPHDYVLMGMDMRTEAEDAGVGG
jgi:hypothetical protein